MIELKFFKDGEYKKIPVNQGWVISETKNEELDEVTIMFSGEENAVRLWQSVRVGESFFNISYIQSDEKRGKRFKYIIKVIEPTKYLEKIICPSMAFTNKNNNLKEQLERAILNAEPVEVGSAPRFKLAKGIKSYLESIDGADFYFERPTLREVLDEMFAVIDARCVVKELSNFNNIEIDFVSLANRKNLIDITRYSKRRSIENIELLGSDIESYAENALVTVPSDGFTDNLLPIFHPNPNGWDTFKTNDATLTTENAAISTPYPIENIIIFALAGAFMLTGTRKVDGVDRTDTLIVEEGFDISRNVVSYEEYNGLHSAKLLEELIETDKFYRENTIYYKKDDTDIRYNRSSRWIFGWMKQGILKTAALSAFWNSAYVQNEIAKAEYERYTISAPYVVENEMISDIRYRLVYVPLINAHFKIGKENYQGPPSTIISQQTAKTIDIARYGDNLYGQINRLGNPELEYDMIVTDPNDIYQLGDYTKNDYILTTREMAVYDRFIKCHYKFTKNFNALSSRIGIAREKRVYNIPLEFFKSDTIIKEYIVADFDDDTPPNNLINIFMYTFDKPTGIFGLAHITNVLVNTWWDGGESNLFELPLCAYSVANTINFSFAFKDNYSVGMSIGNQVVGGKKVIPNPYVNNQGEYEGINIMLINGLYKLPTDNETERARALPRVSIGDYELDAFIHSKAIMKIKDAYEHQGFTFCFEIITIQKDIIIGPALAKNCALWRSLVLDLKVYVDESYKYKIGDKKTVGRLVDNQDISVNNGKLIVSFDDVNISSWAIGDKDRNLYLACNNPGERSIQFRHKKEL